MKNFLINLIKSVLILLGVLLSGCATSPFFDSYKPKGPLPEDTIIKREPISHYAVPRGRIITAPLHPEPEPEEFIIVEPEREESEIESKVETKAKAVGVEYTVKKGDCLCWLAKKYNIRFQDLLNANSFNSYTKLRIGQKIILPGVTEEQLAQSLTFPLEYVVQERDCLWKIARKYGLKMSEIKAANGMVSDRIVRGKKIIIPEHGRYVNHQCEKTKLTVKPEKSFVVDNDGRYTVQDNDSLWEIASHFKVSVSYLQTLNNIADPKKIQKGQKIIVSPKSISETLNAANKPMSSTLQMGTPAVASENMPIKRYDFVEDANFFGQIDEIPIVQVHQ